MNIAFVTDSDKLSGGIKQLYYNIVGLKGKGYNIFIVCKESAAIRGLVTGYVQDYLFINYRNKIKDAKKAGLFFRKHSIDIIHCFHNKGHKIGVLSKIFYSKPRLFVNRGVTFPPGNLFYYHNFLVNGFIANSHAVRSALRSRLVTDKKINVVYNAYESSLSGFHLKSDLKIDRSRLNICAILSNSKWKAPDNIFKLFNKIKQNDVKFHIVGDVPDALFFDYLPVEKRDMYVFWGVRKDVPTFLTYMDVLVHLPRAGDSFPNIILEAFDAGIPVIASNVGGISEILVDKMGGYVVENGNIEDAAKKLEYLLDNIELRKNMGSFNKKMLERFSLERKISLLIKVYSGEVVRDALQ